MYCKILPEISRKPFFQINLADEISQVFRFANGFVPIDNPMKQIVTQEYALDKIKEKYNNQHTFGGYLEDRSQLWSGFEQSTKMIHLGVDINNLTPGMKVVAPCDMTVVHVYIDTFKFNGWGSRIIFKMDTDYLLFGHLSNSYLPDVGSTVKTNQLIGYVGDINNNGGWFVHLHVQIITETMFNKYKSNLNELDGYLLDGETDRGSEYSRDPTNLLFT